MTLAFDAARQLLWYVTDDSAGHTVLRGFDPASRAVRDVPLPPDESYIREFGPLKIDSSGVVWLAGGKRLVRYDPATTKLTSIALPSRVTGALTGATSGPNQGVWPSALTFLDGVLLLARNNVPWLTRYDASFHEVGRIAIPAGYAGARDLAVDARGRIYLLPSPDACANGLPIDVLDQDGHVLYGVDAGGDRLFAVGDEVLTSGGRGGGSWITGRDVTPLLPDASPYCGLGNLAVPDPRGGAMVFLRGGGPDGHSVIEHVVDGRVIGAVTLADVDISSAPRPPGASLPPTTSMWTAALAADASGMAWIGTGDGLASVPVP